jgi:deoxyribonuclease V
MDERPWSWPAEAAALEALQYELAAAADAAPAWLPRPEAAALRRGEPGDLLIAALFAAFPRGEGGPGAAGQLVVTAAVLWREGRVRAQSVLQGRSGGPYVAGLLALRCGALLEAGVAGLPQRPDLLLVDATGRDHPRRAGLALHLGARLGLPSIGVTNRVLVAEYDEPAESRGSWSALRAGDELAGYAVRTRAGARPVLAHAGWRTTPEQARDLALALSGRWRTPLPLRTARTLARRARAGDAEGPAG